MSNTAYGLWLMVALNAGLSILFFGSFLRPRLKKEWRSFGVFSAFVIALFTEMYGFPLTIYLLTSALGSRYPVLDPLAHVNGHLWVALTGGSTVVWAIVMALSNAIILAGAVIVVVSWRRVHGAGGGLVTSGLYARMRHPQYAGLFLITAGFLVQWPTIITAVMWPALMLAYYRLAQAEERDMLGHFGEEYAAYSRRVPMFRPRLGRALSRAKA